MAIRRFTRSRSLPQKREARHRALELKRYEILRQIRQQKGEPDYYGSPFVFSSILLARGFPLKLVAQSELHDAVGVGLSGDLPESGRVDVGARIGKVGVIQGVVGFGAELDGVFVGPWRNINFIRRSCCNT